MDPYLGSDRPFQFSVDPGSTKGRAPLDNQHLRASDLQFDHPETPKIRDLKEKISHVSFVISHPDEKRDFGEEASYLFSILSSLVSEHPTYAELVALVPVLKTQREAINKLLQTSNLDKENLLKDLSLSLEDLEPWIEHVKQYEAESDKLSLVLRQCVEAGNPHIEGADEQEIAKAQEEERLRILQVPPLESVSQRLYDCANIWKENLSKITPRAEVFAEELSLRFMQNLKEGNLPSEALALYKEMLAETLFLQDEITRLAKIAPKSAEESQALTEAVVQLETVQQQIDKAQSEIRKACEGLKSILTLLPEEKKTAGVLERVYSYLVTSGTPRGEVEGQIKLIEKNILPSFDSLLKRAKAVDRRGIVAAAVTEEERQALSLKRPKQERSWLGKWLDPAEWSDKTKKNMKAFLTALQASAQLQKTYQQVSSATQVQAACRTLSLANKTLPKEALNEIGEQLVKEWHERGGYQASSTTTDQALTAPATRHYEGTQNEWNWFQINRGVKLVQKYCEEHHIHLSEDTGVLFSNPTEAHPVEVVHPITHKPAPPAPPPPDPTGELLERFVARASTHPVNDRLLLHGVGDLYGKHSGLEGSTIEESWGYRLALLKDQIQVIEEANKADTALPPFFVDICGFHTGVPGFKGWNPFLEPPSSFATHIRE